MSRYFIAATDYGSKVNNERLPRWRVFTWAKRQVWPSGHIPTVPVSGYFWTDEEAQKEIERLVQQDADDSLFGWLAALDRRDAILACLTVLGLGAVAFAVLWVVALR